MWTQFWDMHSGGSLKEEQQYIYIEAPEEDAMVIFYNRFGHNPERVTCTCCGEDYSISEEEELEQITGYHRGCAHDGKKYIEKPQTRYSLPGKYKTLAEYEKQEDVLIIRDSEISPADKCGTVPEQGYVWRD